MSTVYQTNPKRRSHIGTRRPNVPAIRENTLAELILLQRRLFPKSLMGKTMLQEKRGQMMPTI